VETAPNRAALSASRRETNFIRSPEGGSVTPKYTGVLAASEKPDVGTGFVNWATLAELRKGKPD
jgi:hypothetical protein